MVNRFLNWFKQLMLVSIKLTLRSQWPPFAVLLFRLWSAPKPEPEQAH